MTVALSVPSRPKQFLPFGMFYIYQMETTITGLASSKVYRKLFVGFVTYIK